MVSALVLAGGMFSGNLLAQVSMDDPGTPRSTLSVQNPEGELCSFTLNASPIMEAGLAARLPEVRTFSGVCLNAAGTTGRFDISSRGFGGVITSPAGTWSVAQSRDNTTAYQSEWVTIPPGFTCLAEPVETPFRVTGGETTDTLTLRTYRLAVATTGEFTSFWGGTKEAGMEGVVRTVNRVNQIYEREFGIRFVLVANNMDLLFTNASTDPFSNNDLTAMLAQNQALCDQIIGTANYDVGHVFGTAVGGVATAGACNASVKAWGASGAFSPVDDAFALGTVAHEIGHQFGANHCFNGIAGVCSVGRHGATAYEPGSGSTIMSYPGSCSSDNVQTSVGQYFHENSREEINAYLLANGNCAETTTTLNHAPVVSAGPDHFIPKQTPFLLTASGSDPDGNPLSYCWEEHDLGPATFLGAADNGASPLFRSWAPVSQPFRYFPRLQDIRLNTPSITEVLPSTSRTMRFRVTVRDTTGEAGGGAVDEVAITVIGTVGPFKVTAPNTAVVWGPGAQTVTWNVAGTDQPPISLKTVNILFSNDGGLNFPTVLASGTPNDGSEEIQIPDISTTRARIKVEAAGNVFYDMGDSSFAIAKRNWLTVY